MHTSLSRFYALIAAVSVFAAAGCRPASTASEADAQPALPVKTARATLTTRPETLALPGVVRPLERAVVSARMAGAVKDAHFRVGQAVQAGELVLSIDAAEVAARVAQARAAADLTERDRARESALLTKGAATADTVRSLEDRLRIAQAAVAEAEAMLTYTQVRAPFGGSITEKHVNSGDLASSGAPLFTLEARDALRVEVQVPASSPVPALGTMIALQDAPGAALVELSAAADPVSRSRLAKLALPADTALGSGDFVRVLWPAGERRSIDVPVAAVTQVGQMERIFVVVEDRARLRIVKTGARTGATVEILAGLDAGETVVLSPAATLRDGRAVTVQP